VFLVLLLLFFFLPFGVVRLFCALVEDRTGLEYLVLHFGFLFAFWRLDELLPSIPFLHVCVLAIDGPLHFLLLLFDRHFEFGSGIVPVAVPLLSLTRPHFLEHVEGVLDDFRLDVSVQRRVVVEGRRQVDFQQPRPERAVQQDVEPQDLEADVVFGVIGLQRLLDVRKGRLQTGQRLHYDELHFVQQLLRAPAVLVHLLPQPRQMPLVAFVHVFYRQVLLLPGSFLVDGLVRQVHGEVVQIGFVGRTLRIGGESAKNLLCVSTRAVDPPPSPAPKSAGRTSVRLPVGGPGCRSAEHTWTRGLRRPGCLESARCLCPACRPPA